MKLDWCVPLANSCRELWTLEKKETWYVEKELEADDTTYRTKYDKNFTTLVFCFEQESGNELMLREDDYFYSSQFTACAKCV